MINNDNNKMKCMFDRYKKEKKKCVCLIKKKMRVRVRMRMRGDVKFKRINL